MKSKIIFMGSPAISVPFLEFIHKNVDSEIVVFSQKDKIRGRGKKLIHTPVKQYAVENEIPVYDISIKSRKAHEIISNFTPDLFLVVAYGQILPERVLLEPKIAPLNVHFSLLPEHRGATPVNTALLNGDKKTGTTIMFMDRGMDTGDILYSAPMEIEENDNATSLFSKLTSLSISLLNDNWSAITSGSFTRTPQPKEFTLTKLIMKEDLFIDWNQNSFEVLNKIKAMNLEPGIKTYFRDKLLFIEEAVIENRENGNPGEVVDISKKVLQFHANRVT